MRAAIMLAGENGGADPLTAAELFEEPIPAKLVVLSACETGMGKVAAGDDFLGLVRSFYLGGANAVLNSLWLVDDEGTRLFMRAFHANLQDQDYRAAWLAARNAAMRAGQPPAVYGAFVLGGAVGG